ncbi:MAG: adenylate/guanylate cyclase domain-containing protein, partial [Pseudomonadota bacterium]
MTQLPRPSVTDVLARVFPQTRPVGLEDNPHLERALAAHKREGLELAVRARIIAMTVIGIMLLFISPWPGVLYYEALVVIFMVIGLAQRHYGRVGHSRAELLLLFCDLSLMTFAALFPNPFGTLDWPIAFQYRFETFIYFFVILASATLAYNWRTVFAVGFWTAGLWGSTLLVIWLFTERDPVLTVAIRSLYPDNAALQYMLDPTNVLFDIRIQQIVVFVLTAAILAIAARRSTNLLMAQASAERERANLARYFSPNVVESLSHNDDPLKQVRSQDIAVLFVDIVGFTSYAADRPPHEVITTLRDFHGRMEACVFKYHGTLDKYLGDGLMATFGTPTPGPEDALNALRAAHAMVLVVDDWNRTRAEAGEPPIRASFGLHYGPVVVGDIGANRLEYAVIGNTVNVASRLEA